MNSADHTFLLSGECIQQIIQVIGIDNIMDDLIERTYKGFIEFDANNNILSARKGFNYITPNEGLIEWMPIRNVIEEEVLLKVVAYHPQNPESFQLPTVISTISKYNTTNGHLDTILDGVLPTSLRTGAASAVASQLFGHPESKILGIIGCGAQAITQLHALSRVFDFEKVLYFDKDLIAQNSFEERVKILGLDIYIQSTPIPEIVENSDVLCTATSIAVDQGPLFDYHTSKEWLHINAVGSDFPGKIELPKSLLDKSYVSPDFLKQAIVEGECQQLSEDQIGQDIITCLKKATDFYHLKEKLTVFDSTGMALEDQIVADMFIALAKSMNLGQYIALENRNTDVKNPYSFLFHTKKQTT